MVNKKNGGIKMPPRNATVRNPASKPVIQKAEPEIDLLNMDMPVQ